MMFIFVFSLVIAKLTLNMYSTLNVRINTSLGIVTFEIIPFQNMIGSGFKFIQRDNSNDSLLPKCFGTTFFSIRYVAHVEFHSPLFQTLMLMV